MSIAESPVLTTERFIESWVSSKIGQNRLIAEVISLNKETNRIPDNYHFLVRGNCLIDPETNRPVLEFVAPGLEYEVAKELQSWAFVRDEGIAYWISPKGPQYPCNKAIIHQIAYDQGWNKVVLNSAILFDGHIQNPEEIRKLLFTTEDNDESLTYILSYIEHVSGQKQQAAQNEGLRLQARYYADQIRAGVDPRIIVEEMRASRFLGQNPISCPGRAESFANYTSARANILIFAASGEKKFVRKCGECGIDINDYIAAGYECKSCHKIYKGVC